MTDTLNDIVPARPLRSVIMQQRGVVLGGLLATIGFFLPWEESWAFVSLGTSSGFSFAQTTESLASGNSLVILWIVLLAGIVLLVAGAYAMRVRLERRTYRQLNGIALALAVVGLGAIWLTLPGEIDTWTGLVTEYQLGIWLTTVGLAIGALAAGMALANKEV